MPTQGWELIFRWNITYYGVMHCYCLLFETIIFIWSLEPLLYLTTLRLLFLMGFTCQLLRMSSMADILYTTYFLLLLTNWKWKTTLLLSVLLYVIISSLPNDEVMFLYQNYGLLKLGKYFERALFVYLIRYIYLLYS